MKCTHEVKVEDNFIRIKICEKRIGIMDCRIIYRKKTNIVCVNVCSYKLKNDYNL